MPDPSLKRPVTPEEAERRKDQQGAAVGILASLGCAGFALIMVIVIVGILLLTLFLGGFFGAR